MRIKSSWHRRKFRLSVEDFNALSQQVDTFWLDCSLGPGECAGTPCSAAIQARPPKRKGIPPKPFYSKDEACPLIFHQVGMTCGDEILGPQMCGGIPLNPLPVYLLRSGWHSDIWIGQENYGMGPEFFANVRIQGLAVPFAFVPLDGNDKPEAAAGTSTNIERVEDACGLGVQTVKDPATGEKGKFGVYAMVPKEDATCKSGDWTIYTFWKNGDWPVCTQGGERRLVRSGEDPAQPHCFHVWLIEERTVRLHARCTDEPDEIEVDCYSMSEDTSGDLLTTLKLSPKETIAGLRVSILNALDNPAECISMMSDSGQLLKFPFFAEEDLVTILLKAKT